MGPICSRPVSFVIIRGSTAESFRSGTTGITARIFIGRNSIANTGMGRLTFLSALIISLSRTNNITYFVGILVEIMRNA